MATIILAEDEVEFRSVLARHLRSVGHDVVEVGSGDEVVALIEGGGPADLVITDMNMPEMDGIEVLTRLRGEAVPVIAMSGGGLLDRQVLLGPAEHLGAIATLEKPFEVEELERAVELALGL